MRIVRKKAITYILSNCLKTLGWFIWIQVPLMLLVLAAKARPLMPYYLQTLTFTILIAFIVYSIYWTGRSYNSKKPFFSQKITRKDWGIVLSLVVLLRIVAIGGTYLNRVVTGEKFSSNDTFLQNSSDELPLIYLILFYLIIGFVLPILEELVFRGIFVDIWFQKSQKWLPAVISSLFFSLGHEMDNPITWLMYFTMGMILFFAYYRRKNIKESIMLHMLNNCITILVPLILAL